VNRRLAFVLCAGFLCASALAAGCAKSANSPVATGGGSTPSQGGGEKPAFTGTAEQFATEFAKDKASAEKKYKDKIVELEGPVMDPKLSSEAISLFGNYNRKGEAEKDPTVLVACYFTPAKVSQMEGLKTNQNIKVRGKMARTIPSGVDLIDCDILSK
jgi:tRNA_anti-like